MAHKYTHRIFEDSVDKLVHDKLAPLHNTSVSNEWNALQQQLHPKKTNNRFGKTIGFALLFMLLGGVITYMLLSNADTKKNTIHTIAASDTTPSKQPTNSLSTNKENSAITNDINEPDNANYNTTINTYKVNNSEETSLPSVITKNSVTKSATSQVRYTAASSIAYKNAHPKLNNAVQRDALLLNNNEEDNQNGIPLKQDIGRENNSKNIFEGNSTLAVPNSLANDAKQILDTTQNTSLQSTIITTASTIAKREKKVRALPEHSFDNDKQVYLEAFTGVQSSTKNKNSFAAFLAPSGYTTMRLLQENPLTSTTAGVMLKLRKRHITFSTGVQYNRVGDKVNYSDDTVNFAGPIALKANGITQFTYIDMPLLVGYEWANKRWGINVQAGINAGILIQLKGQYVAINTFRTQLYNVKDEKSNFRKSVFSLTIAPQLHYYYNSNSSIFIAPTYRRNLQPITTVDSDWKQKYNTVGLQIGIRKRIK